MSEGFEHQEPMINFAFSRVTSQPQQVGVRLKPGGGPRLDHLDGDKAVEAGAPIAGGAPDGNGAAGSRMKLSMSR